MAFTVRPDEEQLLEIKALKKLLNVSTSTKALLLASKEFPIIKEALRVEKEKTQRLEWALDEIKRSVRGYAYARDEMMELAEK